MHQQIQLESRQQKIFPVMYSCYVSSFNSCNYLAPAPKLVAELIQPIAQGMKSSSLPFLSKFSKTESGRQY